MKIKELNIGNFGKLSDRKIELSDGINLIYGENESGKSTIHTFIRSMFFGMERGRGRAAAKDVFSRYEPWEHPNLYAGFLRFESGGKTFRIDRHFDKYAKRATLICEDDGEEMSIEDGDLHMILGELTESVYDNTISIGQLCAQPGQPLAAELKNYATNYYASGRGELDINGALEQLKDRKRQIDRQIKEELQKKQERRERIEQEASYIWREVHRLQSESENLEETLAQRKETEKKKTPEKEKNRGPFDELRPDNWRVHPLEIVGFVAIVAAAVLLFARPWNYLVAIVLTLLCLIYTWNRMKVGKRREKTEPELILEEIMQEEEKIPLERLEWELDHNQQELKEKEIEYNNLREQLEEMDEMSEQFWELERQKQSVDLAAKKINELALVLQKQMRERMNQIVSENVKDLTGGRYTRFVLEEGLQISLLEDGRKIPVERLSRGAAEQVYLGLRLGAAEVLQGEAQPIILDDTFAYYDDVRLANALRWLAAQKRQIILFTCQKREIHMLEALGISFQKYVL